MSQASPTYLERTPYDASRGATVQAARAEAQVGTLKEIGRAEKAQLESGKSEGSFKKGGLVIPKGGKKSGNFKLHKGERIVPATKKSKATVAAIIKAGLVGLAKPAAKAKK